MSREAVGELIDRWLNDLVFRAELRADRATLFLVDETRGELRSKVAQSDGGGPLEIRLPVGVGALLYLGLEVALALVFYRLFLWDWLSGLLPAPAVTALGGLLGAGVVVLNAAGALHDLYGARAHSAQG